MVRRSIMHNSTPKLCQNVGTMPVTRGPSSAGRFGLHGRRWMASPALFHNLAKQRMVHMDFLKFETGETSREKPTKANAQMIVRIYKGEKDDLRMVAIEPEVAKKRARWPLSTLAIVAVGVFKGPKGGIFWLDAEIERLKERLAKEVWCGAEMAQSVKVARHGPFFDKR